MSKTKKILLGVIGGIIILLGALLVVYFLMFNKPIDIFKNYTNNIVSELKDIMVNENISTDKIAIESNLQFNSKTATKFANYNYDIDFGIDSKSKQASLLLGVNDSANKKMLEGTFVIDSTNMYLSVPELLNKVVILGESTEIWDYLNNSDSITSKEIFHIIEVAKDSFLNSLDSKDFSVEKNQQITIDGKEIKADKNILKIDGEKAKKIAKNVLNALKEDKEVIATLTTIANLSEDELKQEIDEELNTIDKDNSTNELLTNINFYTAGFKKDVIRISMIVEDEEIFNIDLKDNIKITIKDEGTEININFTELDEENIVGTLNIDNVGSTDFKIVQTKKDNQSASYTIDLTIKVENEEIGIKGTIKISNTYTPTNISTNNAVEYENITEDEMNQLYSNLINNKFIIDIMSELNSLTLGL